MSCGPTCCRVKMSNCKDLFVMQVSIYTALTKISRIDSTRKGGNNPIICLALFILPIHPNLKGLNIKLELLNEFTWILLLLIVTILSRTFTSIPVALSEHVEGKKCYYSNSEGSTLTISLKRRSFSSYGIAPKLPYTIIP